MKRKDFTQQRYMELLDEWCYHDDEDVVFMMAGYEHVVRKPFRYDGMVCATDTIGMVMIPADMLDDDYPDMSADERLKLKITEHEHRMDGMKINISKMQQKLMDMDPYTDWVQLGEEFGSDDFHRAPVFDIKYLKKMGQISKYIRTAGTFTKLHGTWNSPNIWQIGGTRCRVVLVPKIIEPERAISYD